jgi:hypothetical protein
VLATDVNYPSHLVGLALCVGLLGKLLTRSVRAEFRRTRPQLPKADSAPALPAHATPQPRSGVAPQSHASAAEPARGWRVGHQGRDEMYYEEWQDGDWQRLRISGELLMGRAHHVIYFASPQRWLDYPEWARHRRDEIMGRIKAEFRAPDYEYQDVGTAPVTPHGARAVPGPKRKQSRSLAVFVAALFSIAGAMGWLVWSGLTKGETYLPSKRAAQQRTVVRANDPAMYWASLGLYAAAGIGTLGFGAWLLREGLRTRR